ncbi:hypothetical protein PPL_01703 [Heterostelium album PN500]|uniref:Uncharacterized protein n=1 Tax=Heterostelium pallidum (strain ATCC 26659 / Pp 5 / PN500) TaxID=670386 RepID=D3B087_HETP5|nr:hypothetical protein PPL_01703 [Heterostelium album PN500]EFA84711.1 hypothetical protein PPL_01703 [Heterostelium album PN500]|eukprot:XP_020436824.1 hypothetical protein PPL_01703 [Heterostelium album PN500]
MSLQKQLFNYVFKNIVTQRPIFEYVKWIHQKLHLQTFSWISLCMKPDLLVYYGYENQLKSYLRFNDLQCLSNYEYDRSIFYTIRNNYWKILEMIVKIPYNYRFTYLGFDYFYTHFKRLFCNKFLDYAVLWNRWNLLDMLDMKYNFSRIDFHSALEVVGVNGGVECMKWLVSKVNDNQDDIYNKVANLSVYHGQIEITQWLSVHIPSSIRGSIFYQLIIGQNKRSLGWLFPNLKEINNLSKLAKTLDIPNSYTYSYLISREYVKSIQNKYPSKLPKIQKRSDQRKQKSNNHDKYKQQK